MRYSTNHLFHIYYRGPKYDQTTIAPRGATCPRRRHPVSHTSGAARWFPVVSGGWLLIAVIAVLAAPDVAQRLGRALAENEGISLAETTPVASAAAPETGG